MASPKAAPAATSETRTYELVGLIPGSFNDKATEKAADDLKKQLAKAKADITVFDLWARRPLAYAIKGEDQATYVVADFTAAPSVLKALNKALHLESPLLRFSIVSMPDSYRYVSIATLQAQAAEAKEAPAPGLERAPGRRPVRATAPAAATKPEKETAPTRPTKNLDDALKSLDETL